MNRRVVGIMLALLGMWAVATVVSYTAAEREVDDRASTFNTDPRGLRAVFEALHAADVPVQRWRRPYAELPEAAGTLVIARPGTPITARDWNQFIRPWVEDGRVLILASGMGDPAAPVFRGEAAIAAELGYSWIAERPPEVEAEGEDTGEADEDTGAEPELTPQSFRELWAKARATGLGPATARPVWDTPLTPAAHAFDVRAYLPLYVHRAQAAPVYATLRGPYAWYVPLGGGGVILTATSDWLSNALIDKPHNLDILLATLSLGGGRTVLFDERAQGYGFGDITMADVWSHPAWAAAAGEFLLLGLWFVVSNAKRFGRPLPVIRERTRSTLEYVDAMASLYRRAQLKGPALAAQWRSFRVAVAKRYGIAPGARNDVLAERLSDAVGAERAGALRDDLAAVSRALAAKRLSNRDFVRTVKRLQKLREDVL